MMRREKSSSASRPGAIDTRGAQLLGDSVVRMDGGITK